MYIFSKIVIFKGRYYISNVSIRNVYIVFTCFLFVLYLVK